jgi:arsenate reductase
MNAEKPKILILCSRNSCRSQMAEGFFKKYADGLFDVYSAGLNPGPIHPMAVKAMADTGIDITAQHEKSIKEFLGRESFRYIIFVCAEAEKSCPSIYPFVSSRLSWPFEDPAAAEGTEEEKYAKFVEVRDLIESKIRKWIEEADCQP